MRETKERSCLTAHIADGECCAVVGLSNTGKSTLLRELCAPSPPPSSLSDAQLLYIDCNRMLDRSEQGFYEAILRAVRSQTEGRIPADLRKRLETGYERVVNPPNPLSIPLGFNDAMEGLCESGRVVLVLDEFDEPFTALEGRIFLNLRALRDRYREGLCYVTATIRPLGEIRTDPETTEFRELFAGRICWLRMMEEEEARAVVAALAAEEEAALIAEEIDFILDAAGGHPGLLRGVFRLLLRARTEAPQTYARMGLGLVAEALMGDDVVRGECEQLWSQLTPEERAGLLALTGGESLPREKEKHLHRLGVVGEEGKTFSRAFAEFVRQRGRGRASGVWMDEESGDVYVDGRRVPTLTDLEYRLLRTLYRRRGKLCDKYRLVEEVWGESYIDDVDDARVEKLVSRLRAKIEPDPGTPRYLITVRGRGYRLMDARDSEASPRHRNVAGAEG